MTPFTYLVRVRSSTKKTWGFCPTNITLKPNESTVF